MTPAGVNVKHTDKLWINGRWAAAHSGRVIELISPNTEQVIMLNKLVEDEEDAIRTVGQNGLRMDFGLPYGGFKQSGIGREGGIEGLTAYLETKTILLDAAPRDL